MKKVLAVVVLIGGLVFIAPPRQAEAQGGAIRAIVTSISSRASGTDIYLDMNVIYTGPLAGGRTSDLSIVTMLLVPGVTPTNLGRDISTALVLDASVMGHTLLKQNILIPNFQQGQ